MRRSAPGASGFLLKDVRPRDLVDAIRLVADGNALLGPTVTRRLLDRFADTRPQPSDRREAFASMTARELEILRLLASGLSNAEIATRLFLGESTVKTHVSSILRKLGVRDRVQAVIVAFEAGLVPPQLESAAGGPPGVQNERVADANELIDEAARRARVAATPREARPGRESRSPGKQAGLATDRSASSGSPCCTTACSQRRPARCCSCCRAWMLRGRTGRSAACSRA